MDRENLAAMAEKAAELEKREAELNQREANVKKAEKKRLRDNLYERINVSVRTMDIIIGVVVLLLVAAIVIGLVL